MIRQNQVSCKGGKNERDKQCSDGSLKFEIQREEFKEPREKKSM